MYEGIRAPPSRSHARLKTVESSRLASPLSHFQVKPSCNGSISDSIASMNSVLVPDTYNDVPRRSNRSHGDPSQMKGNED